MAIISSIRDSLSSAAIVAAKNPRLYIQKTAKEPPSPNPGPLAPSHLHPLPFPCPPSHHRPPIHCQHTLPWVSNGPSCFLDHHQRHGWALTRWPLQEIAGCGRPSCKPGPRGSLTLVCGPWSLKREQWQAERLLLGEVAGWLIGAWWVGLGAGSIVGSFGAAWWAHTSPVTPPLYLTPHTTVLLRYMESSRTPSGILFVVVGVARGLV